MGNTINFWEIQAEVWATGKYITNLNSSTEEESFRPNAVNDLSPEQTNKQIDIKETCLNECLNSIQNDTTTTSDLVDPD